MFPGIPDERMMRDPVWSTWAEYKAGVDATDVIDFASQIRNNGFTNSQLEIDDRWENCYGDAEFDFSKFPDPGGLISQLKVK